MLLSAEHISKNYGMRQLLEDVSLYLNEKERIGIVGINGTGKSTLLKILAKIEPSDEGIISTKPNLKIVYLPQNPIMNDDFSVLEQVFDHFSLEFREKNSFEAKSMLNRLGISDFNAKIGTLSGGQKKRVSLAIALIQPSDILILDEPTNHLDSEMVCWLEQYLSRLNCGLIMVTHDRYFLERVATKIVELSQSKLFSYEANYSKYLELKAERGEMNEASERKRQSILRREYQWIMRGARARGTKSRERIERYENLKNLTAPTGDDSVQMSAMSSRLGRKIVELKNVSKSFDGRKVVDDFSYMISRDDRIGIVGKNGAGKSTLLNLITGEILADQGSIDTGSTVKIGYFTQECKELDFTQKVYDFISGIASEIKTNEGTFSASQMLERFLFSSDLQYTTIARLSGGERRRLYLLSILMEAPNILLLDEPTNDLDIETLTILEDYLDAFSGAVIAVSHDRYFLDKIASSIFEVTENGKIVNYIGNYSDYSEKRISAETQLSEKKISQKNVQPSKPKKLKFSFNEQHEFETIDDDISALEAELEACSKEILSSASDYVKLQNLMENKAILEADLEKKTERWVYLNELAEKIEGK
ncbi:MAG: ABC-F family ATP-binding cassette domain-containing protein [Oscillospiraceae bacterium]